MKYCICIRMRGGISYEIWPEPKEVMNVIFNYCELFVNKLF